MKREGLGIGLARGGVSDAGPQDGGEGIWRCAVVVLLSIASGAFPEHRCSIQSEDSSGDHLLVGNGVGSELVVEPLRVLLRVGVG